MKVINLLGDDFSAACKRLACIVDADHFNPDLVVGIRTGGSYVGKEVYQHLTAAQTERPIRYIDVKLQRSGTAKKENKVLSRLLQTMPRFVCDSLRILESLYREHQRKKQKTLRRKGEIALDEPIATFLSEEKRNTLIVDDAIDTGFTVQSVVDFLKSQYSAEIKVAVITSTMKEPLCVPDYFLFNNRTLIRFPWSNDVKR